MNADGLFNVLGSIIVVAGITALVARPNTAKVIGALTTGFADSISAALGKGVNFS